MEARRAASETNTSVSEAHLKRDAITFTDGLVIALASTAPAYSPAAVIGSIVVLVGLRAPAASPESWWSARWLT